MTYEITESPSDNSVWGEARKWVAVALLAALIGVAGAVTGGHDDFVSHDEVVREIEVRQAPLEKQVDRIDANVQWLVEREMDKAEGK